MKKKTIFIIWMGLMVLLGGCTADPNIPVESPEQVELGQMGQPEESQEKEGALLEETGQETQEEAPEQAELDERELQRLGPNEAGEIMVLMYHQIKEPEAEWSRTPENFRKDLETLYEKGFRPISLTDYVTGHITTAAGFTPVVITFDDGAQNQFNFIETEAGDREIDPDSAMGILLDFHQSHPDFPLEVTFFINGGVPFGQKEWVAEKLAFIVEQGMDIGNHTLTHVNFTTADQDRIQQEIGGLIDQVASILPAYPINTLALPFGSKPKTEALFEKVVQGSFGETSYEQIAILEVGWDPYFSPFHQNFHPHRIRRVRASETKVDGVGLYDWLKAFDTGKRLRYISDGDPNRITVPEGFQDRLKAELNETTVRIYPPEAEE